MTTTSGNTAYWQTIYDWVLAENNLPCFHSKLGLPSFQRTLHVICHRTLRRKSVARFDLPQALDSFNNSILIGYEIDDVILLWFALEFRGDERVHPFAELFLDDQDFNGIAVF